MRIKENNIRLWQLLVNNLKCNNLIDTKNLDLLEFEEVILKNQAIMLDTIYNMEDEEFLKILFNN